MRSLSLTRPERLRKWRDIVRTLKQAPNFGIHGIQHKNLLSILNKESLFNSPDTIFGHYPDTIFGHYFAIDNNAKQENDSDFYDKLWASISVAIAYSTTFSLEEDYAVLRDKPCLLLGVDREIPLIKGVKSARLSHYGREDCTPTFEVGHEFYINMQDIFHLEIEDDKIKKINLQMKEFCQKYSITVESPGRKISQAYFMENRLIREFLKKIYIEMKDRYSNSN
jgi:hypothetical protein